MNPNDFRFIFVCGLHRSGTSLLTRCLGAHPSVSGFSNTGVPQDEGQHLQSVYMPAFNHGGPGEFAFREASHLTENSPLCSDASRARLFEEWGRHWDLSKSHLLEKSPPNLLKMRFLQALFPNSYFIVILRHPVPVSLATRKWSGTSVARLLEHWVVAHRIFLEDAKAIKRLIVIKYEELTENAEEVFTRVFRFLELPARGMDRGAVERDRSEKYVRDWRNLQRHPLGAWYVRYLRLRWEKEVARFGYSLRNLPR